MYLILLTFSLPWQLNLQKLMTTIDRKKAERCEVSNLAVLVPEIASSFTKLGRNWVETG
jgi:hypothetical protein